MMMMIMRQDDGSECFRKSKEQSLGFLVENNLLVENKELVCVFDRHLSTLIQISKKVV